MNYFNLHSNCIPVLGAKNALICDLFRERYIRVPRDIAFSFHNNKSILLDENLAHDSDFRELLILLEQDDWGHFTKIPEQFPRLNLNYEYNGKISNCIIDIENKIDYSLETIAKELDLLDCHAVQLRFYKAFELSYVNEILNYFQDTSVRYLEVLLQFDEVFFSEEELKKILVHQIRLKNIYVFSAHKDEIVTLTKTDSGHKWRIAYSSNHFKSEEACGKISEDRFTINLINFTEAKNFNSCLNCKIAIDKEGNIKNCPSLKKTFGNVKNTSLLKVTEKETFSNFFSIKKDDIDICKDCEYRYICTDCRAYTNSEEHHYSKPAKCSYNPYNGTWDKS